MAARQFVLPYRPAFDSMAKVIPGAQLWFTQQGTDTPATVYSDSALTQPLSNPVVANSVGRFPAIYHSDVTDYRVRLYTSSATVGTDDPVEEYDPYVGYGQDSTDTAIRGELEASTGAAMIGVDGGGTVQDALDAVAGGTSDVRLDSETYPAATSKIGINPDKTFVAHSGGAADYRGLLMTVTYTGSYAGLQLNAYHAQAEARHTSGALSFLRGMEAYTRLGVAASTTGTVLSARVFEGHVANESANASCSSGIVYYANDVDWGDDHGTTGTKFGTVAGFASGNLGHASKLSTSAVGFDANNMTGGAPLTAAFRSQMSFGSGKWGFLSAGSAANSFYGNTRIGDNTVPSDALEVKGFVKASSDGTFTTTGNYHETASGNSDFVAHFRNTNGSQPYGIRVRFTGAAPNNTTQQFLLCEDSSTTRLVIWSNGNVVNSNNSYGAISDKREKSEIHDASSQLADIRAIRVRKFRLKSDPKGPLQIGVIAQEVEKVSPGLVFEQKLGRKHRKAVNYSVLYMKAFKALQELADEVDTLKAELAALKAA